MAANADVERLLRRVPLASPADESHAVELLQNFVSLRNDCWDGLDQGLAIPGITSALGIPTIIQQMRQGDYASAASGLVGVAGDAAGAYAFLIDAGVKLEAFSGFGALASSGAVAGMVAEAAGPASLALTVLVETFRIPADATNNLRKLYFATDASGILTSWLFDMPEINPHARLAQRARVQGPWRTDISDTCRMAHDKVHELWRSGYQGKPQNCRAARAAARNSWEGFWRAAGAGLNARLGTRPRGACAAWIDNEINAGNRQLRLHARRDAARALAARQRRAAGGYHFRTPEGVELFMPDP